MNTHQIREASLPVNPRAHLGTILNPRLEQWFKLDSSNYTGSAEVTPHEQASSIVAVYDAALNNLKGKKGPRVEAARQQITAARAPLAEALSLVNELQADLSGPRALDLQKRITSTRANLAAALAAKELATRSTIDAALLEVERCLADVRELDRDIAALYEKLSHRMLRWPDLNELQSAEPATRALEQQSAKNPKAVEVFEALEQGFKAPAYAAALWVAFETLPDHELTAWRWRAYSERTP